MDSIERRVLFISYNGMLDPLGQSQVLPYLRQLARRKIRFTLLSFERSVAFEPAGSKYRHELHKDLSVANIEWHVLRYHKTPSVPATVYDVLAGIAYAKRLIWRNRIELVHARSHIPATIAVALKKLSHVKMIFDVRGLMAEEYVESHHWAERSTAYRLTKSMEQRALAASDGIVTLTEKVWPIIHDWVGLRGRDVIHEVIPCCADLSVFRFNAEDRIRRRQELGLDQRLILVYSGSIGSWYRSEQMADFFVQMLGKRSDAHFLWLTPGEAGLVDQMMQARGLGPKHYTVRKVTSADVPSYLSASDVGIAFYNPGLSKFATSPVKVTEYLACGLSVILNSGIGDSDAILGQSGVGAIVSDFTNSEYARVWNEVDGTLKNVNAARERARKVAQTYFDLCSVGCERYFQLYQKVLKEN